MFTGGSRWGLPELWALRGHSQTQTFYGLYVTPNGPGVRGWGDKPDLFSCIPLTGKANVTTGE